MNPLLLFLFAEFVRLLLDETAVSARLIHALDVSCMLRLHLIAEIHYGNADAAESLSAFQKFWKEQPSLDFLNTYLDYRHLDIVEDGDIL